MQSIKQWLAGKRDYAHGVALHKRYGANILLERMFAQGYSEFRHEKLIRVLTELQLQQTENAIASAPPPKHEPVAVATTVLPENAVAPVADPFRDKWLPLFMERNHLRARLPDFATDEERGKAAHEILRLHDECERIWAMREQFLQTGKMPAEIKTDRLPVTDVFLLQKQLQNVRSYITKARAKADAAPNNQKHAQRLRSLLAQKTAIEKQLMQLQPLNHATDETA